MHLKASFYLAAVLVLSTAAPSYGQLSEAATHGKAVFAANCAICHNADNNEKKIGPGMKGLYARGVMQDNTTKVNDETVTDRIENGKMPMPGYKATLKPDEIKDLVEYLRTL